MTALLAYPYQNAGACLSLEVANVPESIEVIDDRLRYVGDFEGVISIEFRAAGDVSRIEQSRPSSGSGPCPLQLVLRIQSVGSRVRDVLWGPIDSFDHQFTLQVDPKESAGTLTVQPLVVLAEDAPESVGTARDRASTVAWGPTYHIEIDEPSPPIGKSLPIEWRNFSEDTSLDDAHLFAVRVGALPTILLNSDINGAHEILTSKGTHGARARIRDATFSTIVHQVWTSLLGAALARFTAAVIEWDDDVDLALGDIEGWMADAIRDWARPLFPLENDLDAALQRLREDCRTEQPTLMVERVPRAIQERFSTTRSFSGFVSQQHLFEEATS